MTVALNHFLEIFRIILKNSYAVVLTINFSKPFIKLRRSVIIASLKLCRGFLRDFIKKIAMPRIPINLLQQFLRYCALVIFN